MLPLLRSVGNPKSHYLIPFLFFDVLFSRPLLTLSNNTMSSIQTLSSSLLYSSLTLSILQHKQSNKLIHCNSFFFHECA